MTPAEIIRQARAAAGITQNQLAERCGIPHQRIGEYETGRVMPGTDRFMAILRACGAVVTISCRQQRICDLPELVELAQSRRVDAETHSAQAAGRNHR